MLIIHITFLFSHITFSIKNRFDEIVGKLKVYIEQDCGFHSNNVKYVPVSGLLGNNIVKRCDNIDNWYTGATLVKVCTSYFSNIYF